MESLKYLNQTQLAKDFLNKSKSWFTRKLYKTDSTKAGFTQDEKKELVKAFREIIEMIENDIDLKTN